MVDEIADDMLAFPFGQSLDGFRRQQRAWMSHDSLDRVSAIRVPTLVVAGGQDSFIPAALGRDVADRIPGAELVVLPDEAHQPFQERPEQFNEMVDASWVRVDRTPRG